jgi:signal peptidase II
MAPVAVLIAIIALFYSRRNPHEGPWTHVAMGLLAAGALGNLYDRLALGHVTDMIYIAAINFPVFNVADACITVAACMLLITWSRDMFKKGDPPSETAESTSA